MLRADDDAKFSIKNETGEDIEYDILFSFDSEETNKSYIVYTDNSTDEDGNINVYASTYDSSDSVTELKSIETEKEWEIIESILESLQDEIGNEKKEISIKDDTIQWISKMKMQIDAMRDNHESEYFQCASEIIQKFLSEDMVEYEEALFELLLKVEEKSLFSYNPCIILGLEAYKQKKYPLAEMAFKKGRASNNLAYLIRRGEVKDPSIYENKVIPELLKEGVCRKDPFCMVNMALFWALNVGLEKDWKLADRIMYDLPEDHIILVCNWWKDVAMNGDSEGLLVHYWLLKYKKISISPLGTEQDIKTRLRFFVPQMPLYI